MRATGEATPGAALAAHLGPDCRVAVVHDWLVTYAGAERVLEQILLLFPRADVFTLVDLLQPEERGFLHGARVRTSFLDRLPLLRQRYRLLLPLMPLAIEQMDVSAYDLVISSSHAIAKGIITGPRQLHLCYCHSPIRYAWDLQHEYLREAGLEGPAGWPARWLLHRIRMWDARTANGVDRFAANSRFVAQRVRKVYRRRARVIHPPVDIAAFTPGTRHEGFYLAASRFVPYKRMALIVDAFRSLPDRRLVVIGDGPEFEKVRKRAGPNVALLGWQPADVLRDHMRRARAFVFAAEEDFGIAPVEAQACGTPVIAYGRGGALDTMIDRVTGVLFHEQSGAAIASAVERFEREEARLSRAAIRANAERFSVERFRTRFARFVMDAWDAHTGARRERSTAESGARDAQRGLTVRTAGFAAPPAARRISSSGSGLRPSSRDPA